MHRGLPSVESIESVDLSSSELEFGASEEISPSGSGMSSYVPSASEVVSICNAVVEN